MRILTYKQTHIGDPHTSHVWGETGCMGMVRNQPSDAVIGIGGSSWEPVRLGIDHRITWIGAGEIARVSGPAGNDILVFERFARFDAHGPFLVDLAPRLAKRMYGDRVRHLSVGYTPVEQREAEEIIAWFLSNGKKKINGAKTPLPVTAVYRRAHGRTSCPPAPRPSTSSPICPPRRGKGCR